MALPDDDIDAMAATLLAYLRDHPDAGDTVDGMAQWWLHRCRYERVRETIERALERLVAAGVLSSHRIADGTILYTAHGAAHPGT